MPIPYAASNIGQTWGLSKPFLRRPLSCGLKQRTGRVVKLQAVPAINDSQAALKTVDIDTTAAIPGRVASADHRMAAIIKKGKCGGIRMLGIVVTAVVANEAVMK